MGMVVHKHKRKQSGIGEICANSNPIYTSNKIIVIQEHPVQRSAICTNVVKRLIFLIEKNPLHRKKEMSGLHKSFPPIPPRPYWRTHEVSTKFANNLLLYKHFYLHSWLAFSTCLKLRSKILPPHTRPDHIPCSTLKGPIPIAQGITSTAICMTLCLRRSFNTIFHPDKGGNTGGPIPLPRQKTSPATSSRDCRACPT